MPHLYKPLSPGQGVLYAWFPVMHTRADLVLCGQEEKEIVSIVDEIATEWTRLEKIGNFYDTGSELYKVNQMAYQKPVHISNDLCNMIAMCLRHHPRTEGCFDITIQSDNYSRNTLFGVILSSETSTISYKEAGMRIDLSGFLKGYALESARQILAGRGVENALLSMGNSSVLALGNHPHGEGWKVAFATGSASSLQLYNQCLTTSGNETDRREHIISPQTGELVAGARGIAIITESATEGEIYSTALFAATTEQRERILRLPVVREIHEITF